MSQEMQNKVEGIGSEVRYATGYMMPGEVQYEAGGMGSEKLSNTPEDTGRSDEAPYGQEIELRRMRYSIGHTIRK